MAGGMAVVSSGDGKKYAGKMTFTVIWICILGATGGLIFGYDIGISGGVTSMDPFLKKFFPSVYHKMKSEGDSANQYCKFNSPILQLFTSSLYLAALVASFAASTVTRKFGRRMSMRVGGFVFLMGAALNAGARNVGMLIAGRILLGFGVGFANQSVPLYLSEMAPSHKRGFLNILFQQMITVGILIANIINYFTAKIDGGWGWRVSLGGAMVPALIIFFGSFALEETPNSLIERFPNQPEKARKVLCKIRGTDDIEEEFRDILAASEVSRTVEHPWKNIRQRKYRPQLIMAVLIPSFQQLTGMNIIMFYAPVLFKTIGLGDDASLLSALITGIVNMFATFVAIFTVDRFGRRRLLLEGGIQMLIAHVIVAVLFAFKFGESGIGHVSKGYGIWILVFVCIFVAGFAWSWGPLGWLVPSEIFPLEIRSAGQTINVSLNMLFTFLIGQVFLNMLCHMKFGLFLFFAGLVFVMTVFVALLLPETKGVMIDEMMSVWRNHWHWKKYVTDDDIPPSLALELELGKFGLKSDLKVEGRGSS